ncbi:nitrate/nitrite transporter NrtS [Streptomyces sp. NPDC087859]|uniref:nitrate/nitrite transporter NrtS n=1 Tax=Streptomyces sp. NPDC087859 TaxID=3365812 RepID=UPI0038308204
MPVALLVGTLLSLVNQGSVIASGDATAATWLRVLFNYLVPFCVSSAGFFGCPRAAWRTAQSSGAR